MSEEKKEEQKNREIVIETDGNMIRVTKAEVAGLIEMIAILENLVAHYKTQNNLPNK